MGRNASLALGRIGRGAGMVVGNVQPPLRALYVGYRAGTGRPILMPFVPDVKVGLGVDSFVADGQNGNGDSPDARKRFVSYFGKEDIIREISMSGETWRAGSLAMTVTSFFGEIPDPDTQDHASLRRGMRPAIYVRLSFDNSGNDEPMTGIFGMQGIHRPLSDSTKGAVLGFVHPQDWGFATNRAEGVDEVMEWSSLIAFDGKPHPIRRLASEGCLRFTVPAGEKKEYVVAIGSLRESFLTSGIRARLFQSTLFSDVDSVLCDALAGADEALAIAALLDAELDAAPISDDRKFLIAHGAHSYNASTELLMDESGKKNIRGERGRVSDDEYPRPYH